MIKVETFINLPGQNVWEKFTQPQHIQNWNFATPEWHCPKAENELKEGGKFSYRMEAKDGSFGFDFSGVFDEINPPFSLKYHLDDARKVEVTFTEDSQGTRVIQSFQPDPEQPEEMQKQGWQAILDNFKKYAEYKP